MLSLIFVKLENDLLTKIDSITVTWSARHDILYTHMKLFIIDVLFLHCFFCSNLTYSNCLQFEGSPRRSCLPVKYSTKCRDIRPKCNILISLGLLAPLKTLVLETSPWKKTSLIPCSSLRLFQASPPGEYHIEKCQAQEPGYAKPDWQILSLNPEVDTSGFWSLPHEGVRIKERPDFKISWPIQLSTNRRLQIRYRWLNIKAERASSESPPSPHS